MSLTLGPVRSTCTALLTLMGAPLSLLAQDGYYLSAGRVLAGTPDESSWRLTVQRDLFHPVTSEFHVQVLPGARPASGQLVGVGGDIVLFPESLGFPAVVAGVTGGLGLGGQERLWAGTSLGLRVTAVRVGVVRVMLEGRWRSYTLEGRDGVEVAAVFGFRRRPDPVPRPESVGLWAPRSTLETLRASGIPEAKAAILNDVVRVAIEEMGQPYVWGGTGDGRGGFDCSGLIYYAYGRRGISVPRTSQGQSRAGTPIAPDIERLLPGDILTFAERGDSVTHVGLYVGEGRFIHSASRGVRLSRLAEEDGDGRYWLRRWVGVRRIVE